MFMDILELRTQQTIEELETLIYLKGMYKTSRLILVSF